MTYGLVIWTPANYIKIDPSYSRFKVSQSGSGTTSAAVTVAEPDLSYLMFVRPAGYNQWLSRMTSNTTTAAYVQSPSSTCTNFSYVVSRRYSAETPVNSGYGLNIYGASGEFLYSSNNKNINIDFVVNCTLSSTTQNFTLPSVPFGTRYICMLLPNFARFLSVVSPMNLSMWMFEFTLTSETNLSVRSYLQMSLPYSLGYNYDVSSYGKNVTLIAGYV